MRTLPVIALLALVALVAGCGDDDSDDQPSASEALAGRVDAWRGAANSYNVLLQTCQGPKEKEVIVPQCTRRGRQTYAQETARLNQALQTAQASSPECRQAIADVKTLSEETTTMLTRSYRVYATAERAVKTDREYDGPAVIPLLTRTNETMKGTIKRAQALSQQIRETCDT
jgi:uncharacterized protein YukE